MITRYLGSYCRERGVGMAGIGKKTGRIGRASGYYEVVCLGVTWSLEAMVDALRGARSCDGC